MAEESVGFVYRGHVVGHHAAVAGGGYVEGFSGAGSDEVASEASGAEDGSRNFAGGLAAESTAEGVRPAVLRLKPEFNDAPGFGIPNGFQIGIELESRNARPGGKPALFRQVYNISFVGRDHISCLNLWW